MIEEAARTELKELAGVRGKSGSGSRAQRFSIQRWKSTCLYSRAPNVPCAIALRIAQHCALSGPSGCTHMATSPKTTLLSILAAYAAAFPSQDRQGYEADLGGLQEWLLRLPGRCSGPVLAELEKTLGRWRDYVGENNLIRRYSEMVRYAWSLLS